MFDDATPSANSLAANGLLRLAALTGETELEEPARAVLRMLAHAGGSHPNGFAHLLAAIERFVTSPAEIAIIGDRADDANARAATRGRDPARARVGDAHRIARATRHRSSRAATLAAEYRPRTCASTTRASSP